MRFFFNALQKHRDNVGRSKYFLTITKRLRAFWLVAIAYKSADNKNDVRCNTHAFSTENKVNSARTFSMLL